MIPKKRRKVNNQYTDITDYIRGLPPFARRLIFLEHLRVLHLKATYGPKVFRFQGQQWWRKNGGIHPQYTRRFANLR